MSFQQAITEQAMKGVNDAPNDTLQQVFQRRFTRREMLRATAALTPTIVLSSHLASPSAASAPIASNPAGHRPLGFSPISLTKEDAVVLPEGYDYQVLLKWGDAIFPGHPDLDLEFQNGISQSAQFGYNCDFNGYFPLPTPATNNPNRAILCTNHEYTDETLMFPGYVAGLPTGDQVDAALAAHGMSFVEIERKGDAWQVVKNSRYNRRLTGETPIEISGPARGNDKMKTSADPTGTTVRGTLNNCAGGKTPWGTVLTCEENFNQYFAHRNGVSDVDTRNAHTRYGLTTGASDRRWENFHSRFDLRQEPNEPFRFGWIVETDPYNPHSVPKKRTALGRFKHEGATCVVSPSGKVVVYSGDDERFDYVYKFVSAGNYNPTNRLANMDLLDEGMLFVAKFNDDGSGEWLPLVHGHGPLTAANGFHNQGDVVINTRRAADLLGATKMDRPEDIEANPVTGKVYSLMTNNTNRGVGSNPGPDAANPRSRNRWGHVIEQTETHGDHASTTFTWEIFILCGDPADPTYDTFYGGFDQTLVSPFAAPDNLVFDDRGICWIATDGLQNALSGNDGIFAVPTDGPERGFARQFMSCPLGAEICGPEFNPDNTSLFVAIQHPGEGGTFSAPVSNWPLGAGHVARPSVIVVRKSAPGIKTIGS